MTYTDNFRCDITQFRPKINHDAVSPEKAIRHTIFLFTLIYSAIYQKNAPAVQTVAVPNAALNRIYTRLIHCGRCESLACFAGFNNVLLKLSK